MRTDPSNTRQRIIDAAYLLFYKTGFMRSSIDAVAEAAGITKRTLYQHFDSKDALIEGCHVLVLIHCDTNYIRVAAEAAAALLQRQMAADAANRKAESTHAR